MFPTTDDIERTRIPAATLALVAAGLAGVAAALLTGDGWTALALLACALFTWVFGATEEDALGAPAFLLVVLVGAAAGAGVALALGEGARSGPLAGVGAVTAVIAVHLVRFRGARVLSLVLVPFFAGLAEVRAWVWALVWPVLVAALAALGAFEG